MIRQTALRLIALALVAWVSSVRAHSSEWKLACRDDELNDARECVLANGKISVFGVRARYSPASWLIRVNSELRAGSQFLLRVDDNPPIPVSVEAGSNESTEAIRQMMTGTRLHARYLDAQDSIFHEGEFDLGGFREQAMDMQERLEAYAK